MSKKKILGYVISSKKMKKTIIVNLHKITKHNLYNKFIKKNIKVYVHDENNITNIGDYVEIIKCRPISKIKHWKLLNIIKKNKLNN